MIASHAFKTFAISAALVVLATQTQAVPIGDVYPAPGGNAFASSGGPSSQSGGVTWTYSGFDTSGASWSNMYWGNVSAGIAMDGLIDNLGFGGSKGGNVEVLNFDTISGNVATTLLNGHTHVAGISTRTRYKFTLTDLSGGAINFGTDASFGVTANGMLADVTAAILGTGGFKVKMEAEEDNNGDGTYGALGPFFDSVTGAGAENDLITDFTNGLWYDAPLPTPAPEPGTLALFGLGLAGLGAARRRRRRGTA